MNIRIHTPNTYMLQRVYKSSCTVSHEIMKLHDEKSLANDSFYYFIISRGLNENTWIEYNVNNTERAHQTFIAVHILWNSYKIQIRNTFIYNNFWARTTCTNKIIDDHKKAAFEWWEKKKRECDVSNARNDFDGRFITFGEMSQSPEIQLVSSWISIIYASS